MRKMLAPFKTALLYFLMLSLCHSSSAAQQVDNQGQPTSKPLRQMQQRISNVISREMEKNKIPAFSIALVADRKIVFAQGLGVAKKATGELVDQMATADTVYRVGSISKLFTDLAVMQLVEQGKLDLDVDVKTYLPDFHPKTRYSKPITLRQLMSHRSGLVRETPIGNYFDPNEPTVAETTLSLNQTQLVYEPETRTKYSNAGITVVGRVLEKVTGQPFDDVIAMAILKPLKMDQSSFSFNEKVRPALAEATMWTYDGRTFAAPNFKLGIAPAGNLYSTVNDLSKFMLAIFNQGKGEEGDILSSTLLGQMLEPQFDKNGYGIGFHLSEFEGHRVIEHGGAVYGFSTQWIALPDKKIGVIAASSKDITDGVVKRICHYALKELLASESGAPAPKFKPTGPIVEGRIQQLVGSYRQNEKTIEIYRRNDDLMIDLGTFKRTLRADDDGLVCDDAFGHGPRVTLTGKGLLIGDQIYRRLTNRRPDPLPDKWNGFVGEYGWDHNTLYVYEKHGTLWCTIEWFFQYPLTQVGPRTFAFPNYGLYHGEKLVFDRSTGPSQTVIAANVTFLRRAVGTKDGETFKIKPVKPISEIRKSIDEATPPRELGEFKQSDLVELVKLDPKIQLDIRYATDNNFMGATFYSRPAAYMQRPAAEALVRVHKKLRRQGYGLLIHDAYRPWFVTKMFWDATPQEMKIFVANPKNGSRHNRGCAVDLTLYDIKTGKPIWMGAGYDEFSTRSFPDYPVDSSRARWHRDLLRATMESEGFTIYQYEWWHFDYQNWQAYPILNQKFQ